MGTQVGKTAAGRVIFTCRRCPEQVINGFEGSQVMSGPRWLGARPPPPAPHGLPRAKVQRRTDEPAPRFKARGGRR
jgi:hypothetical protein